MTFRWLVDKGPSYSIKKSLFIILLSNLTFCLLFALSYLSFSLFHQQGQGVIQRVVVKTRGPLAIKASLFAELLSLSVDQPLLLDRFERELAEKKLHSLGIFRHLLLKTRKPDLLLIDYELEQAAFIAGLYENLLVNEKGALMAYAPYFSPKKVPILYLEREKMGDYFSYATEIVEWVEKGDLLWIDMRNIEAESKAKREVVLKIQQGTALHLVRLDPIDGKEHFMRYFALLKQMKRDKDMIIDLRFPRAAFISFMNIF